MDNVNSCANDIKKKKERLWELNHVSVQGNRCINRDAIMHMHGCPAVLSSESERDLNAEVKILNVNEYFGYNCLKQMRKL